MKNKKIIIWAAVGVILLTGITTVAVKKKSGKQVPVFAVTDVSNAGFDYGSVIYGVVSSEATQEIKYNSNQKVEEVFVSNGQKVKKGDKLVAYDLTVADIELQMKKLDKDGIGIEIQKLRRDISELRNTKPAPPITDIPDLPTEPDEPIVPEEPIVPDLPAEPVSAQEILDEHSLPYSGKGLSNDPFHYLVSQKGTITGKFLNKLAREKQLFVIEVRQGDVSTGEIMKFYGQKMSENDAVENDDAIYNLELSLVEKVEKEKDIPAYDILGKEAVEKEGWISGNGTKESPYLFLVKDTGVVKGSFFNLMKEEEYYFRLEVRAENKNDGIIVKAWEQNGKFIKDAKDSDEYKVDIKLNQAEVKPEEVKPEEVKPEDAKPEEVKPEEVKPEDAKSEEVKPEDVKPEDTKPEESKVIDYENLQSKGYRLVNTATVDYVMDSNPGFSASDIKAQIAQIESQIKDLQLNEREAELEINKMEKELENKTIVSALDGIVTISGNINKPSSDGSPMLSVKSEDGLYVKGEIPEWRLSSIDIGTKLEGTVGSNGLPFTAEITFISPYPSGDKDLYGRGQNSSMYPFTARIDNSDGIENDAYVDLKIIDDNMKGAGEIEVLKPFVRYENGKYFVMKANDKGKLEKQYVNVKSSSGFIKVSSGITMNDHIAFPYGKNVKEGASVREAGIDELYGAY